MPMLRALRVLALGIFLGIVGVAYLNTRRPAVGPAGPGSPSSAGAQAPFQARTDEIFRASANLPPDPTLASQYHSINVNYFEGRLPAIPVRWEPRLAEVGPLIAEGFEMDGMTNGRLILLNPSLQEDEEQLRRTLVHEIVHVAIKSQTTEEHGALFQSRLRQLSEQGAFVGTVATEEEKQQLKQSIAARVRDMEKAEVALGQTRTQLDADTARVQAQPNDPGRNAAVVDLQNRADFYNADIQRFNIDVGRLNRMIEDYNLMVAYPDGLDRERLAHRGVLPGAK